MGLLKVVFCVIFTIIALGVLVHAIGFNQIVSAESKNFLECYRSFSSYLFMMNVFSGTNFDLLDTKMKAWITNICNFYHEKTGVWVNIWDDNSIANIPSKLHKEFVLNPFN
jgi:hypothetical protein